MHAHISQHLQASTPARSTHQHTYNNDRSMPNGSSNQSTAHTTSMLTQYMTTVRAVHNQYSQQHTCCTSIAITTLLLLHLCAHTSGGTCAKRHQHTLLCVGPVHSNTQAAAAAMAPQHTHTTTCTHTQSENCTPSGSPNNENTQLQLAATTQAVDTSCSTWIPISGAQWVHEHA